MRGVHPDSFVNPPGVDVFRFDIEPKAADVAGRGRLFFYKIVEATVDLLAAKVRQNVDALYPPKPAVPPVAPFVGDHQAADDRVFAFGDGVKSLFLIAKDSLDAAADSVGIESFAFGLERHRLIKFDQRRGVAGWCDPDYHSVFLDELPGVL